MMSYQRILLKLSGESLAAGKGYGIDPLRLNSYASQIKDTLPLGVQLAVVIGGGNIFRGLGAAEQGFDRIMGDQMGMLATVINSLALSSALTSMGVNNVLFTSIRMEPVGELYSRNKALERLQQGHVAIFAAGTGNPLFSTDTAAALRGIEIGADVMLKGTRVDGVYSADPEKDPTAVKFPDITFDEIYRRNLRVMDLTATTLCKENNFPVVVFDMDRPGNLLKVVQRQPIGTLVH
ncbi:MAG: UMP kinase [Tannerellaceae bacterium]|nr:UMP kinase [Tannerellaceae bacterium]